MGGVLRGIKIITSFKKVVGVIFLLSVSFVVNGLLYFTVLSGVVGGMLSVVSLSFYVYYLLVYGL
jgi:hypothetical protein